MTPQGASDLARVQVLLDRYMKAWDEVDSTNPTISRTARRRLDDLFVQAQALYAEIVSDPFRWQEGLGSGAVSSLDPIRNYTDHPDPGETYGVCLPDQQMLTDRAVESYRCGS